jgi:hypothetical protein
MKDDEKDFDAVKMTRAIRDRMAERYLEDPDAERRDLEAVWKKYGLKPPEPKHAAKIADRSGSSD